MNKKFVNKEYSNLSEEELIQRKAAGDKDAREELILRNIEKAGKLAEKLSKKIDMEYDDIFQNACIGVIKAVDGFDYTKGTIFSRYIESQMRNYIKIMYARKNELSINLTELVNRMKRKIGENKEDISDEQLAEILGCSISRIGELKTALNFLQKDSINSKESLNNITYGEDDYYKYNGEIITRDGDVLHYEMSNQDKRGLEDSKEIEKEAELQEEIQTCLSMLDDRDRTILELRFGLKDGIPKTSEEVGKIFGITGQRIRQIEKRALERVFNRYQIYLNEKDLLDEK